MKPIPFDQKIGDQNHVTTGPVAKFDPIRKPASAARRKDLPQIKVMPHPHATPPPFRNPLEVAMLQAVVMTDCTVEATLRAGADKREGQEICVIFGYQDERNYYFVHLGSMAVGHVNHLYCVQTGQPNPMSVKFSVNTTWLPNTEHRLRVERIVRDGLIRVYFDDLATPVLEAVDRTFDQGQVGIGTFGADLLLSDVQVKGVRARNFQRPTLAQR
jgi:hypothetical protein